MRIEKARELWQHRPTTWEIDLTPPVDEEDEDQLGFQQFLGILRQFGKNLAIQGGLLGTTIHTGIQGIANSFHVVDEAANPLNDIIKAYRVMESLDDARHGNHLHAQVEKKGQSALPKRKTNTGPPWNPHARGGKGGR